MGMAYLMKKTDLTATQNSYLDKPRKLRVRCWNDQRYSRFFEDRSGQDYNRADFV
jgi:hypothetical protein